MPRDLLSLRASGEVASGPLKLAKNGDQYSLTYFFKAKLAACVKYRPFQLIVGKRWGLARLRTCRQGTSTC